MAILWSITSFVLALGTIAILRQSHRARGDAQHATEGLRRLRAHVATGAHAVAHESRDFVTRIESVEHASTRIGRSGGTRRHR